MKLEQDRRKFAERIAKVKKEIEAVRKRRASQKESREKSPVPTVSLVGYTSAGKSTLFNCLAGEKRYTSPNLFATLDPVLRRVSYPDGLYFYLTDTVGFIKRLPVELVTSFRATLEEVKEASAVCHIVDATSPHSSSQAEAVESILADLGVSDVPVLKVFNKIDLLPESERRDLLRRNESPDARTLYISAKTEEGVDALLARLRDVMFRDCRIFYVRVPVDRADIIHSLPQRSIILKRREREDAHEFKVMADPDVIVNYLPYLAKGEDNW